MNCLRRGMRSRSKERGVFTKYTSRRSNLFGNKCFALFTPVQEEIDSEIPDDDVVENIIELPEFRLDFVGQNRSMSNGDWVTFESTNNATYTIEFTHSQNNSRIRWTDALNANPFWSAATKTENGFSITIDEPTNLIHIESTNLNGEIHIVRVGVDWPDEQPVEPEESDETVLIEEGIQRGQIISTSNHDGHRRYCCLHFHRLSTPAEE